MVMRSALIAVAAVGCNGTKAEMAWSQALRLMASCRAGTCWGHPAVLNTIWHQVVPK
ncbi:hypothetical protein ACQKI4_31145 [Paenibacillus glucanolyticus]|uniref:hypothetical protein n=2 Tax=Paenibacillus glucanolyticus TaxID=59843 RepID=UPI0013E36835|nr:hypothetical protein [Paenibacillus glucanolyticus]